MTDRFALSGDIDRRITWLDMVARWCDRDAPMMIGADGSWSGRELFERAAGAAQRLTELCGPGAVPALVASSPAATAYLIGGAASGRPLAPLGPRLTRDELVPCVERFRLGQIVRAVVVRIDSGSRPGEEELRAHVRSRLAGFKVPVDWIFTTELPRNADGKVVRKELASIGEDASSPK